MRCSEVFCGAAGMIGGRNRSRLPAALCPRQGPLLHLFSRGLTLNSSVTPFVPIEGIVFLMRSLFLSLSSPRVASAYGARAVLWRGCGLNLAEGRR